MAINVSEHFKNGKLFCGETINTHKLPCKRNFWMNEIEISN